MDNEILSLQTELNELLDKYNICDISYYRKIIDNSESLIPNNNSQIIISEENSTNG